MIYDIRQGTQLSPSQRLALQQRAQVRSFMHPVLAESVAETIKELEVRKEQGAKPERVWFKDREEKGTICIADWMGF